MPSVIETATTHPSTEGPLIPRASISTVEATTNGMLFKAQKHDELMVLWDTQGWNSRCIPAGVQRLQNHRSNGD